jgi:hypothetical protein
VTFDLRSRRARCPGGRRPLTPRALASDLLTAWSPPHARVVTSVPWRLPAALAALVRLCDLLHQAVSGSTAQHRRVIACSTRGAPRSRCRCRSREGRGKNRKWLRTCGVAGPPSAHRPRHRTLSGAGKPLATELSPAMPVVVVLHPPRAQWTSPEPGRHHHRRTQKSRSREL